MSAGSLFGSLIFSMIGMGAFIYGRKNGDFRSLMVGIALMTYPYFARSTLLVWGLGAALTAALFLFRGD